MSADNGIYILKTKDQYRVIHAQAIENLYYSHINPYNSELVPTRIIEYYGDCRYTRDFDKAMKVATAMERRSGCTEYGIKIFHVNKTWNQIVREAKSLALKEIERFKDDESSYGKYQKLQLQKIIDM
jgi:hypothetical protein